jgi:hypothetical protein
MFEAFKPQKWTILTFLDIFFSIKCTPFFFLIKEDFNIDD